MTESDYHKQGKEIAKNYLLEKDFKENEIFEEYIIPNTMYRVDVVGIKDDFKVGYEIGGIRIDESKISKINEYFDEMYILHYDELSKLFDVPKEYNNRKQVIIENEDKKTISIKIDSKKGHFLKQKGLNITRLINNFIDEKVKEVEKKGGI